MTQELRAFQCSDLEIRNKGIERIITGLCVPFDHETEVRDFVEVFRKGSFAKTITESASKVKLLAQHNMATLPLGAATNLRETGEGLVGEFRISKTLAGDEAIELVRDGALDSFSVGFVPIRSRWNDAKTFVERQEVRLLEVSLVAFPAYEQAKVLALRNTESPAPGTPRLDVLRRKLKAIA